MNQADTAWMLISTALVLPDTDAGVLLRGLVRSERAQHHDDEFHLARSWALSGP
jgi:ammonia channel protein AmtB